MPFTPFHLGPGLFLGALNLRFFNLWAILLGSVIMDIEPLILAIRNFNEGCRGCPDHAFFHSILGAFLGSGIITAILWFFRGKLNLISLKFRIYQNFSFKNLYFSSLLAWLVHIFFDNLIHFDVFPFWPLKYKPFFIGPEIYWLLNSILIVLGILGFILIIRSTKGLKPNVKP